MLNDYYDCPKDLRKDYWKVVVEALGKIAVGIATVVILVVLFVIFN